MADLKKIQKIRDDGCQSGRICLRKLRLTDVEDMYDYTSDEETVKFLAWGPHKSMDETAEFIYKAVNRYSDALADDILWGLSLRSEDRLIGVVRIYNIGDNAEISYILNRKYWGKGYMTEAVKAAVAVCKEKLDCRKVYAYFSEKNTASCKVMQRCGMMKSDIGSYRMQIKGDMCNFIPYEI